ncbi:MAG: protein kinase [Myxococcaceae bacterium]|nr:protein kinase [Myxococcaceae bacterium]
MENLGSPVWIGQYRLTSRIATGGMAEVYVGRHISEDGTFGPMVAVKKLLPHLVKDSAIVRMFLNEARITAQIHHPNVVRIFELGQVSGEPFIAMELLEGRTFADLRARAAEDGKRMPLPVALRILCEACRGLGAAHEAKDDDGQPLSLVHRDFTPDNVHVGVKGEIKVIDFGIAKTANWGAGTEPGTLKGKFFYMSPEMILAKPVDHRADIFAAGVMLYEQMCGRRPFTGNSVDEVVMRIAEGKLQPPSAFDPSLPRALEAVCLTALNKNPNSRFQTMGVFIDAMEMVGGEAQLATNEEVADYVGKLFPQTDRQRETLRRAREADPSVPGLKPDELRVPALGDDDLPPTAASPGRVKPQDEHSGATARATPAWAPTAPLAEESPTGVLDHPPSGAAIHIAADSIEASVTRSNPSAEASRGKPTRRSNLPVILGVVGLLVVGAAAFAILGGGGSSAKEQLALAEQATTPEEKGRALQGLGHAPDVSDEQLQRAGELLVAAKQWAVADEVADDWLKRSPKNVEPHLLKARAAVNLRKGKRAETEAAEASALAPDDPRPDIIVAELRELQADSPGALEAWTKAARKRPGDAQLLTRQGYWLSQSGRLDDAADVLGQALKKQFVPEAAAELAFVKLRKDQYGEALSLLAKALKEKPDLMVAHYYRAAVLYQKGDAKAARAAYLEADKLAGADSRPLVALCELEVQQQTTAELEDVKKRLKERFPADADKLIAGCAK